MRSRVKNHFGLVSLVMVSVGEALIKSRCEDE